MVWDLQSRSAVLRPRLGPFTYAITSIAFLLLGSVSYAAAACGHPASNGLLPTATDALFALRSTVALEQCDACVCDVDGSGATTTSDALTLLRAGAGDDVAL